MIQLLAEEQDQGNANIQAQQQERVNTDSVVHPDRANLWRPRY